MAHRLARALVIASGIILLPAACGGGGLQPRSHGTFSIQRLGGGRKQFPPECTITVRLSGSGMTARAKVGAQYSVHALLENSESRSASSQFAEKPETLTFSSRAVKGAAASAIFRVQSYQSRHFGLRIIRFTLMNGQSATKVCSSED